MEDIHMIGHSLGAHTSGVVGHRLQTESNLTIGRISGLDPAEPAYEFHHEMIRLDQGDAAYVDVIHTNGAPFIPNGGAGLFQPCGHVDFYVNGGKSQPDCPSLFSGITSFFSFKNDSKESALDSVACSHSRAHGVFTESINSLDCQFLGYPCPGGYTDFQTGKCLDCGQEGCSIMGYSADIWHSSGSMYLNTRTSVPFCGHHYYVEVHMSSHTLNTKGRVEVKLEGTWGTSEWMEVSDSESTDLKHGSMVSRVVVAGQIVGRIKAASVRYTKYGGALFGWGAGLNNLRVYKVVVVSGENNEREWFCARLNVINTGESARFLSNAADVCVDA